MSLDCRKNNVKQIKKIKDALENLPSIIKECFKEKIPTGYITKEEIVYISYFPTILRINDIYTDKKGQEHIALTYQGTTRTFDIKFE